MCWPQRVALAVHDLGDRETPVLVRLKVNSDRQIQDQCGDEAEERGPVSPIRFSSVFGGGREGLAQETVACEVDQEPEQHDTVANEHEAAICQGSSRPRLRTRSGPNIYKPNSRPAKASKATTVSGHRA